MQQFNLLLECSNCSFQVVLFGWILHYMGQLAAVLTLQVANVNRTLTSFSIGAVIVSGTKLMIGSSLNLEAVSIDLDLPLGQYLLDNIILLTISSSPSLDGFFIRWVDLLDRNLWWRTAALCI